MAETQIPAAPGDDAVSSDRPTRRPDDAVDPDQLVRTPPRVVVWLGALAVFGLAFAARLTPMLPAGGMYGLGNYDDGVNYAAAAVFVEGYWPYRDFLLLHPPGIVAVLAPFALVGSVFGDPTGMVVGRLGWMALGGVNALLIARLLKPLGLRAALLGGVCYAVSYPAVYAEHTLLLEPPGTFALLVALLLIKPYVNRVAGDRPATMARVAVAGALLGAATSIKIWGVLVVALMVVFLAVTRSRRAALVHLGAAAATCAVICLPFFIAAPRQMWTMVVTSQLGRPRGDATILERMIDISGMSLWGTTRLTTFIAVWLLAGTVCFVVAALEPRTRLFAIVFAVLVGLLLATPAWFVHYTGLTAAPGALVAGAGLDRIIARVQRFGVPGAGAGDAALGRGRRGIGVVLVLAALLGLAYSTSRLPDRHMSRVFRGPVLAAALADRPGCVGTDDPGTLIQMDLLRRNLDRGCPVVVDLGGYNYVLPHPDDVRVGRGRNPNFQTFALDYFRAHDAVITVKFRQGRDYTKATAKTYESWPVLFTNGSRVIRIPQG